MKKTWKALLLAVTIASLSLSAACSSSNNSESVKPSESAQSSKPAASAEPSAKEPVTITTVVASRSDVKFDPGEDYDKNAVYDAYAKDFGIVIKNQWVVDTKQFADKLKMSIASNDVPDFFPVNASQLKDLMEADMIMDLTDVYEKTATEQTKQYMTMDGGAQRKSATFGGKLMAIPQTGNPFSFQYLWIRSDWMKQLNLQAPKTMDDVVKIAEAFAKQDPGGTGQSYGLAAKKDLYSSSQGFTSFFNGYNAYPGIWIDDGKGGLVNGDVLPEMKTALQALQDMFKRGLIDPEFAVKDGNKAAELIYANKVGMTYGAVWMPDFFKTGAIKDGKVVQEWTPYPIPAAEGTAAKSQIGLGTATYYVVSKNCKNPEAVIQLLNNFIEVNDKDTPENRIYLYGKDGVEKSANLWTINPLQVFAGYVNNGELLPPAIANRDPSKLETQDQKIRYGRAIQYLDGDVSLWWEMGISGPGGSQALTPQLMKDHSYMQNQFYVAPTATMVEKGAILSSKRDEMIMKIIMNQVPVDEYDKFVEDWKKLGGDQITKEVNEWYAANK